VSSQPTKPADVGGLEQRYLTFVDKLVARGRELVAEAVPQLQQMVAASDDINDLAPRRVAAAVTTQFEELRAKATQVLTEQILSPDLSFQGLLRLNTWVGSRDICTARCEQLTRLTIRWREQVERAAQPDYVSEYRKVLAEFDATKDSYRCQQCGSPLTIDRIFVIDVYVTCPQCQTQSHFAPSTAARALNHVAIFLARQLHADYLDANDSLAQQLDQLEDRWYDIKMQRGAKAERQQLRDQMVHMTQLFDRNYQEFLAVVYRDLQQMFPENTVHYQQQYALELGRHQEGTAERQRVISQMAGR